MFAVQQPLHTGILAEAMGLPAWRSLPSWYMVAQHDDSIPPVTERRFAERMGATTVEVAASHVPMVSRPADVVRLIETAAGAAPAAA
jgi:pimeloyl-ACP methyl ester carboxylesterase